MASTPWHRGSGRGVTAGEGERTALLLLLWKRPRPPSGHQPPADMSPKLRASLINDALPPSRSHSDVSSLSLLPVSENVLFCSSESRLNLEVGFPVLFSYPVFFSAYMSPILIAAWQIVVNVLN